MLDHVVGGGVMDVAMNIDGDLSLGRRARRRRDT
jgi:hypothetical protein